MASRSPTEGRAVQDEATVQIPFPALIPDDAAVRRLAPGLAAAAQGVYDAWDQDASGIDPELGGGGICDRIADAFLPLLSDAGVESLGTIQASCGENHIYVIALLSNGVFTVDIPPGHYEHGSGYAWTKRPGIVLGPGDIRIDRVDGPMSVADFEMTYLD